MMRALEEDQTRCSNGMVAVAIGTPNRNCSQVAGKFHVVETGLPLRMVAVHIFLTNRALASNPLLRLLHLVSKEIRLRIRFHVEGTYAFLSGLSPIIHARFYLCRTWYKEGERNKEGTNPADFDFRMNTRCGNHSILLLRILICSIVCFGHLLFLLQNLWYNVCMPSNCWESTPNWYRSEMMVNHEPTNICNNSIKNEKTRTRKVLELLNHCQRTNIRINSNIRNNVHRLPRQCHRPR